MNKITEKKVRSINLPDGITNLVETNLGIILSNLIISKTDGELIVRITDSINYFDLLELDKSGTFYFNDLDLPFWKGAKIQIIKKGGESIVTCSYWIDERAKDYSIWSL
jgi:hypothetical protein